MAQQPSTSRPPVSDHYLTQAGLTVALAGALAAVWPSLDLTDLRGSLPGYEQRVTALVRQFSRASGGLAARDYQRRRAAAGIHSRFTVPIADPPPPEQLDKSLHWALGPLWNADVRANPSSAAEQVDIARTNVEGVVARLVLDVGRLTVTAAVNTDRKAHSWARETRPGCCYFCAMLATRGGVYRSEGTAGRDANERFVGEGDFKFHDHCKCVVVPVFGLYEPPAHTRQWQAEWQRLKDEHGSVSLDLWRQHFEGRVPAAEHAST